jgi:hypothetical protein
VIADIAVTGKTKTDNHKGHEGKDTKEHRGRDAWIGRANLTTKARIYKLKNDLIELF